MKRQFWMMCIGAGWWFTLSSLTYSQWVRATGSDGQIIQCFAVKDGYLFAGGMGGVWTPEGSVPVGGVFRSSDNGYSWIPVDSGLTSSTLGMPSVTALAVNGVYLFAGTDNGVFYSTNNGTSWSPVGMLGSRDVQCLAVHKGYLYAGTYGDGVFFSTDNGNTWMNATSNLPNWKVPSFFSTEQILYAGIYMGGVFATTDTGAHWFHLSGSLGSINELGVCRSSIYAGSFEGLLQRSTDLGSTWIRIDSGLGDDYISGLLVSDSFVVVGTSLHGAYLSTDSGTNWRDISADWVRNRKVSALLVSQGHLILAFNSGIGLRPLAEILTDVLTEDTHTPQEFALLQNYPNPFNPSTEIRFALGANRRTELAIFDMLGRKVTTLISGPLGPGTHVAHWNASGFQSGVYFCRLTSGDFTATRKLLLIK